MKIITIGAISLNNSLIPYDYIPYMDPSIVGDYPLYGTISMKNLIVIYAHMKIFSLFKYEKYFNLIFVLDGIKWRIKDIKGGRCCFPLDTFLCDNPCNFEVEINISNKKVIFYKLQDRTDSSYYNLGRYIAIPNEEYKNKNLTLQINIKMNETTEIDSYKFENINVMASTEKLFIGVLGNLRNTEIYFGIKYYCIRSNGENCVNDCDEELHLRSEYCREDGSRACANGASDLDKCKNKSIKCTESLCNYYGICSVNITNYYQYDQTQICICYPGYTGTVCQTWYCEHECHGNGECIGPNQCRCRYPYWGWECNKYQCDRKSKKICGDLGICSYNDQNFLCECKHPLIEGSYCDKIICTNSCVYGNCKYNELEVLK
ncbi:hypothetical protein HZS_289 [Henneguya salminicola]|nr:hypothetical protein HZS_289 [Henneguya salminicola]